MLARFPMGEIRSSKASYQPCRRADILVIDASVGSYCGCLFTLRRSFPHTPNLLLIPTLSLPPIRISIGSSYLASPSLPMPHCRLYCCSCSSAPPRWSLQRAPLRDRRPERLLSSLIPDVFSHLLFHCLRLNITQCLVVPVGVQGSTFRPDSF